MNPIAILTIAFAAPLVSCVSYHEPIDNRGFASAETPKRCSAPIANLIASGSSGVQWSDAERELYHLIMKHREDDGLPAIPLSKSLSLVAKVHVRDLETNTVAAPYNLHSWSGNGPWRSVNYTPDHRHARLMWSKPRELTKYNGNGYEIVYMNSGSATPADAFATWKASELHHEVLDNRNGWRRIKWQAIGVGIAGRYAVAWFGQESDPDNS